MKKLITYIYVVATCIHIVAVKAQDVQTDAHDNAIAVEMPVSPEHVAHLAEDMTDYITRLAEVQDRISISKRSDMADLQNIVSSIDVQWQAYTQIAQVDITASPTLMELLSQYKVILAATNDSLAAQMGRMEAEDTYNRSLAFLTDCKTQYASMVSQAQQYALVPQTQAQLADVKAREALLFAQVTDNYQRAVAASQLSSVVSKKMPALEKVYIELSRQSDIVKTTVYKSWIERIKDYVLTFAGVAIILIFFNFVASKIKAAKQARDMAKKYGDMLNTNNDYPTI